MKTINLEEEKLELAEVVTLAREGPVLLLTSDGKEFFISEVDDFAKEVESLRASQTFQRFLDERSKCDRRVPLEEIELEIEKELADQRDTA